MGKVWFILVAVLGCTAVVYTVAAQDAPDVAEHCHEVAAGTTGPPVWCEATTTTTVAPAPPTPLFLDGFFPIGVDLQPADSATISKWRARGVNTFIREPLNATDAQVQAWSDALTAAGMRQIRRPLANPAADINSPSLLAWAPHRDEPEAFGSHQTPWQEIQADAAALRAVTTDIPIHIAIQGTFNQRDNRTNDPYCPANGPYGNCDDWYAQYFAGADWLTGHRYVVNNGSSWLCGIGAATSCYDGMVYRLRNWQQPANVKPWFAYIEASDYDTSSGGPSPTAAQLRAQVWYVISQGARGVWYFPERVAPTFSFDATTAAIQAEMTTTNGRITAVAPALQSPVNPPPLNITAAGVQVGWRVHDGHTYIIAVNMTATALAGQTISGVPAGTATVLNENRTRPVSAGVLTDDFAAYGVHVYRVPYPDEVN